MALFKVSFKWQQTNTRVGGWSENFWNNANSSATALTRARALLDAWNQFKGAESFCKAIKISQYPSTRIVLPYNTGFGPTASSDALESDYPTTKVQLNLLAPTGQATNQWIGGIRDGSTKRGGFWQPTAFVTRAFNAVKTLLEAPANGWSLNVLNPAFPKLVITAINAQTGQVTTSVNNGYANDDYVRIQRVNGIDHINGIWQIKIIDGQNFTLNGWPASTQTMTRSNARAQKQDHQPQVLLTASIVQVTSHKVGKPGGQLGGKKKKPSRALAGPLVAK